MAAAAAATLRTFRPRRLLLGSWTRRRAGRRGKMISDRCSRSSTRCLSPFLSPSLSPSRLAFLQHRLIFCLRLAPSSFAPILRPCGAVTLDLERSCREITGLFVIYPSRERVMRVPRDPRPLARPV